MATATSRLDSLSYDQLMEEVRSGRHRHGGPVQYTSLAMLESSHLRRRGHKLAEQLTDDSAALDVDGVAERATADSVREALLNAIRSVLDDRTLTLQEMLASLRGLIAEASAAIDKHSLNNAGAANGVSGSVPESVNPSRRVRLTEEATYEELLEHTKAGRAKACAGDAEYNRAFASAKAGRRRA